MPNHFPPANDDGSIPDDEPLLIRVFPDSDSLVPIDQSTGQYRPTSGALKGRDKGPLSVDRASLSTPEQTRDRSKAQHFHVAAFTAGIARKHGCKVVPDPLQATATEAANPAHVSVFGKGESGGLTKSQIRAIAKEPSTIVVLLNENALFPPKKAEPAP